MAGHSQFANIKHRKDAQDRKRANLFTKLVREIIVSAKAGLPDPAMNARLRAAVSTARQAGLPKDRIDGAIKRASGVQEGDNYEEMRYEGYGPGGVALMIEALTDNRNRTAADIRSILTKNGGNLGETGSVSFMFDRVGLILYPIDRASTDQMLEAAIEAGAEDCSSEGIHVITTTPDNLHAIRDSLSEKFGDPEAARIEWRPKSLIEVSGEAAEKLSKLLDTLDDHDDVQNIFSAANI